MPRFADLTVAQFLDAVASPEPTPGGGTAAAIVAATGAALLAMVAGLTKTRHQTAEEAQALAAARTAISDIRARLLTLADVDSEAFNQVMAAYRLPKGTEEEKAARKIAVQRALRAATDAPVDTLRATADAFAQARIVAAYGNRTAESDVRTAIELLEAAAAGAAANVEINLAGLSDEDYRRTTAAAAVEITNRVTEEAAAARGALARG
jgi:glutamate formiminotransferase/formiminotetrahydrofolate cyclodeaminase